MDHTLTLSTTDAQEAALTEALDHPPVDGQTIDSLLTAALGRVVDDLTSQKQARDEATLLAAFRMASPADQANLLASAANLVVVTTPPIQLPPQ